MTTTTKETVNIDGNQEVFDNDFDNEKDWLENELKDIKQMWKDIEEWNFKLSSKI